MSDPYYDDGNPYASPPPGEWEPPPLALTEAEIGIIQKKFVRMFQCGWIGTVFMVLYYLCMLFFMMSEMRDQPREMPIPFLTVMFSLLIIMVVFGALTSVPAYTLSRSVGRSVLLSFIYAYLSIIPIFALLTAWELKRKFDRIQVIDE